MAAGIDELTRNAVDVLPEGAAPPPVATLTASAPAIVLANGQATITVMARNESAAPADTVFCVMPQILLALAKLPAPVFRKR